MYTFPGDLSFVDGQHITVAFIFLHSTAAFTMSRSAIVGGATCHKISKGITFHSSESDEHSAPPSGTARPLLLLFTWLGARPPALAKYCQAYSRTGCDLLIVETEVRHFLWPRWALDYTAEVLKVLESDRFISRPLLVHSFSIGSYTFSQLLVHLSKDTQRYQCFIDRVKGHVYDSVVMGTVERMAAGLGKNTFPLLEGLIKWMILLYFRVFRRYTVDIFNAALNVIWNNPITAPALFFFCENDAMCDHKELEDLIEYWKKRGVTVQSRKWVESKHAGHLRHHPQDYLSALDNFLQSLNMTPLKAKM
ncbi:hypothetical protein SKAU_G00044000 [Synaphobranchus kaupii]|uniref:Uncharacterized protein n=1 Tax=Synaphobranchus kaupii TaxID=118154 RepID=A0A9Q1G2Z8_SYNKA|nr:hypothetical protein SKAU_G00044000 [Synaphobranchus kaupii]